MSFDFTALLVFLQSLFDAFVKLFDKFGFSLGGEETDDDAGDAEDKTAEQQG